MGDARGRHNTGCKAAALRQFHERGQFMPFAGSAILERGFGADADDAVACFHSGHDGSRGGCGVRYLRVM
jgi:hypothetical protein